jgi:predicted nucleotidyltransferase
MPAVAAEATPPVAERFNRALDGLVEQVKGDRAVLAAILCGSLSHDVVWARSDIDLALVTIDDSKVPAGERALWADGVNVHAFLIPRAQLRRMMEGALDSSFMRSLLAKGRVLFTHDPTIAELCAGLSRVGERDTRIQLLAAACHALPALYKAHKWLITRADLEYSALYLLGAANGLAKIEVISARQLVGREVLPDAMKLNPAFFKTVYVDLLNTRKTERAVRAALAAADGYLAERAATLFAPVLEHLQEVGEARAATEIEDHFVRNYGLEGVTTVCEYLADQGLVGKAGIGVQLTRKSNREVQELAFFALPPAPLPSAPLPGTPSSRAGRTAAASKPRGRRGR